MGVRVPGTVERICDVMLDNSSFTLYTKFYILFFFQKSQQNVGSSLEYIMPLPTPDVFCYKSCWTLILNFTSTPFWKFLYTTWMGCCPQVRHRFCPNLPTARIPISARDCPNIEIAKFHNFRTDCPTLLKFHSLFTWSLFIHWQWDISRGWFPFDKRTKKWSII